MTPVPVRVSLWPLQWHEVAVRLWTRPRQRHWLPTCVFSSLENNDLTAEEESGKLPLSRLPVPRHGASGSSCGAGCVVPSVSAWLASRVADRVTGGYSASGTRAGFPPAQRVPGEPVRGRPPEMRGVTVRLSAEPGALWQSLSGPTAASASEGLSPAVFMNPGSRPFGPRGKIQTFLVGAWFMPRRWVPASQPFFRQNSHLAQQETELNRQEDYLANHHVGPIWTNTLIFKWSGQAGTPGQSLCSSQRQSPAVPDLPSLRADQPRPRRKEFRCW